MQTKEQILELRYNRLANTNQSTPWNKVPTIYKTIALEAMELYASQQQGGMRWVKASTPPKELLTSYYCIVYIESLKKGFRKTVLIDLTGGWHCEGQVLYWLDESEVSPTSQPAQGEGQPFERHTKLAEIIKWFAANVSVPGTQWNQFLREINNAITLPLPAQGVEEAAKAAADLLFNFSKYLASNGYKINGYDDAQLLVTIKRFLDEQGKYVGASFIQSQHPSPAKQAIEFAENVSKQGWLFAPNNKWVRKSATNTVEEMPSRELYNLVYGKQ